MSVIFDSFGQVKSEVKVDESDGEVSLEQFDSTTTQGHVGQKVTRHILRHLQCFINPNVSVCCSYKRL